MAGAASTQNLAPLQNGGWHPVVELGSATWQNKIIEIRCKVGREVWKNADKH